VAMKMVQADRAVLQQHYQGKLVPVHYLACACAPFFGVILHFLRYS
jgi:hypothetical protein